MDRLAIQQRCVKAGARVSGVNGYTMAESESLSALFTPESGCLLSARDGASKLGESDYDLLRVIVDLEGPRVGPPPCELPKGVSGSNSEPRYRT